MPTVINLSLTLEYHVWVWGTEGGGSDIYRKSTQSMKTKLKGMA